MAREDPSLKRHVQALWPEIGDLAETGEAVDALQGSLGWVAVVAVLSAEIEAIEAQMEAPQPLSRADYAVRHGRIGGLKAAMGAVGTIAGVVDRRLQEQRARHEAGAESLAER